MPNVSPAQLEWNEENFSKVVSDLYRESETDQTLHARLIASPLDVISSRVIVPPEYVGGIFAREKGQKILVLYVPPFGAPRAAASSATSNAQTTPDYEVICTTETVW